MNHPISTDLLYFETFSPADFNDDINTILRLLKTNGIIFIKDIYSDSDATLIANKMGITLGNIDSDNNGITEISNRKEGKNKKNSAAFTTQGLPLHTDRSPLITPPNLLMNWMHIKNCAGGAALLVDGYKVYHYLETLNKGIIETLMQLDVACFTDSIDTYTGPIFSFNENGVLNIRFRYDQCSFFKIDAKESIQILRDTMEKFVHVINFEVGCGYVIANNRWLHGRKPFEGYRMVRRIHINGAI